MYSNQTSSYNILYPGNEDSSASSEEYGKKTIDSILELNDRLHEAEGLVISEGTYSSMFSPGASTVSLDTLIAAIPYSNRKILVNTTSISWTGLADSTTYWLYATVVPDADYQLYSNTVSANKVSGLSEPPVLSNSILLAKAVTTGAAITVYSSETDLGTGTNKRWLYTMWDHRTAATIDHPDSSVTNAKIASGIDPEKVDDYSNDLTEMRTQTDPYPGATPSPSQPTDLTGEIARLRYQLDLIIGKSYWYEDPDTDLYSAAAHIADTSDPHGSTMTVSTAIGVGLTPTANMDGVAIESGLLTLKETTTPTADTNYGKVYTKSDNKLYFQDGAGVEHEIAFV